MVISPPHTETSVIAHVPRGERNALERAAVVGQESSRASLVELGGDPAQLALLVRKVLIRPSDTALDVASLSVCGFGEDGQKTSTTNGRPL